MGQEESSRLKSSLKKDQIEKIQISKSLFDFLYIIGRGGFGKVWKVRYKKTHKKYALKEMSKVKIIDRKSEKSIKNEKEFLSQLHHPFLVNMICSFQDKDNLYLVMDLLNGGDLRYHICHKRKFSENETKFFLACVIIGLEYIHSKNIIHRDIKPENLVLDSNGYVAITDFGVAKKNMKDNSSETSGTPGYMAPEVLCAQNHSFPVDFFALGVMGFEFMNGYRPYLGRSRKEIKDAVLSKQARIHRKDAFEIGWSVESCDFINGMIYRKPDKRLGFNGIEEIKSHQWFNGFSWEELKGKKMKSFFIPKNGDNFDRKYCEGIEKIDSETRRRYSYYMSKDRYKDLFRNYTFVKKELLNGERKENLKGNFIVNNSNRNTTASSKSSGNNFIYGSNNIINRDIINKKNDNNDIWEKTPLRNQNFNRSTSLMKYMENNISNHSSHKNSNSNSLHNNKITSNNNSIIHNNKYININSNNNSHHNSRHIISASAIPVTYNKYSSLNIDRRNNASNNKKLIFSPPHEIYSNLNFDNGKSSNKLKKEVLSKTMQHNDSMTNIPNKFTSPRPAHSRPISRMNINLNNGYFNNISNYKNNSNYTNRRSLYHYPNSSSNLSQTNFNSYLNNTTKKYYNSNNNENKEIKTSRYNRNNLNREKSLTNRSKHVLSKNSSMKLLNFKSSYLNNISSNKDDNIYKLNYNNYRNNKSHRILSAGHNNFEKESSKYVLSHRTKQSSNNNSNNKKNSNLNRIHLHLLK